MHNKHEKHAAIFSMLDCEMANPYWINTYPSSYVEHHPIIGFDYPPIVIDTQTRKFHRDNNFKIEAKEASENNFRDLVKSVWSIYVTGSFAYQLIRKRNILKQKLKRWNFKQKNGDNAPRTWKYFEF